MIKEKKEKDLKKEIEDKKGPSKEDSTEPKKDLDEKELLLAQIEGLEDNLLRAKAELQNVRRVSREEVTRARLFGVESLSREFILVGDYLERALEACINEANIEVIREGLELTLKSFEVSLETAGIIPINPKHETFDPEKHEAISVVEDNKKDSNTIIKVIQRGFTIQDRTLRPAKVIVTKKPDKK